MPADRIAATPLDFTSDRVRVAAEQALSTGQFDERGVGDVVGQIPALRERKETGRFAAQDQRRNVDALKQRPGIDSQQPGEPVGRGSGGRHGPLQPGIPA